MATTKPPKMTQAEWLWLADLAAAKSECQAVTGYIKGAMAAYRTDEFAGWLEQSIRTASTAPVIHCLKAARKEN